MRTFERTRQGAGTAEGRLWLGAVARGAGGRLPDQGSARGAVLRPAHPADPQELLRRQHLALPRHRPGDGDRPGQPGSDVVRGRPEATRRAPDLRQLPAPAAAAEGAARGGGRDPLPGARSTPARSATPAASRSQANSDAYFELKRWLDNGANRDGIAPAEAPRTGIGDCNTALPPATAGSRSTRRRRATRCSSTTVQPFLRKSCAYGTCHSSPQADFYLTCGDNDEQTQVQLRAGRRVRRAERHGGRAERDLAAAAVAAGRRCQPHGRRLLQVARRRHVEDGQATGRCWCR